MSSGETAWCSEKGIENVMSLMVRIGSGDVPKLPVELSGKGEISEMWRSGRGFGFRFHREILLIFPDWNSVQSPVNDDSPFSYLVRSPEERISGLVSRNVPDWLVSCDWVNVREVEGSTR
ncbi:mitogen-activated protein kinase kinase kinase 21 [Raphanus sativus]|nr:mitogen-activated protein kinase kinase kinase 21 [Raphanus sativus]